MDKSYSKDDLINLAEDVLTENRGWWNSDDPADQERINDIDRTQNILSNGKLADPYGAIEGAYNDYHEFIANSKDSDFENGTVGKQNTLDELNVLLDTIN